MEAISLEFVGEAKSEVGANAPSPHRSNRPTSKIRFQAPTIGHICARCRAIPPEIFLIGSSFFSHRCQARQHVEDQNCEGKHDISCHHCRAQIEGTHYHCGVCNDDDLDICAACRESGAHCLQQEHKLCKRIFNERLVREVEDDDESYFHPGLRQKTITQGLEPYRLHDSLGELLASAEAGCHSCSVLVTQLDEQLENAPMETPVFIENRPLVMPMDFRFVHDMMKLAAAEPPLDSIGADEGLVITMLAVRTERDADNPIFEDPTKDRAVCFLPFELRGKSRTFYSRHVEWLVGSGKLSYVWLCNVEC
jgi:hypothetical protein